MEATQFDVIIERLKLSELDVESMKGKIQVLQKDVKVGGASLLYSEASKNGTCSL